jgi:hypothetical protein
MFDALKRQWTLLIGVLRLPVAHLRFDTHLNPAEMPSIHRAFTRPHPKYKIFPHKAVGAALVPLRAHASSAAYLDSIKGKRFGAVLANKAKARGYRLCQIDRNAHAEAIHAINTALDQRQGRPMDAQYREKQASFPSQPNYRYYGVFDRKGQLVAYCNVGYFGNFAAFCQLMGQRNNDGFMHMLVVEIVTQLIDSGQFEYLMYDTFFGAQPGLRTFKSMLGFQPYHAKYTIQ